MNASWKHVAADVRFGVVDTVKPARLGRRAAIGARLHDQIMDLANRQVARIRALVGFAQEHSATFVGLRVASRDHLPPGALLRRHQTPALSAPVSPFFPGGVAWAAFIGQPVRPTGVAQKYLQRGREFLVAPVADLVARRGGAASCARHINTLAEVWAGSNDDGPHFQLPWKQYPKGK